MAKKGGDFELIALDFLENIFQELEYEVVRKRTQKSGSQDGFDNLVEVVDKKYKTYTIYSECKDYSTPLNYTMAIEKIPHIVSTHKKIDLLLFISPYKNFSNTNEDSKLEDFYGILGDDCPIEFLAPESYIKEYFALYPNLYNKVYKDDINEISVENRIDLLKKFEKLIFSDKNLKKTIISEEDRKLFIDNLTKDEFHITRSFRKHQDRDVFIFENPDYEITLEEQLNLSNFGVVVLGNPGSGKSHELRDFAIELWENRDIKNNIPKFRILKNFISESNFSDLLPKNYKKISNLTIILDGIDEIHDITSFATKFRFFLYDNQEHIESSNLKFIVSCRTNIYHNHIKNIEGFDVCFLNEIPENLAVNFLLNKFDLDITKDERFSYWKFRDILQSPFYLELLGKHYNETSEILLNKSKLLEAYVENRLKEDEKIKYLNDSTFSKAEILEQSKRIALSMEAMQKSVISTGESTGIIEKKVDLSKNSLLQQNIDETWSFEHKNIQEYLVAKILSTLDYEQIIEFIQIDSTTAKIHPTWNNVISFLLNLEIPPVVFKKLTDWIIKHDLQLIFQLDSDRIDEDIRTQCLITKFTETCIKETLWLDSRTEIARFGNTTESVKYLIAQAKNTNLHLRVRITAIQLLASMNYIEQITEIKNLISQILTQFESDTEKHYLLLQDAFKLIQNCGIDFYRRTLNTVKKYDLREVVSSILTTIPQELIEENINYFLEILDKAIGEKSWEYPSKYASTISTKEYVFELFQKVSNPERLTDIYSYLIDRNANHDINENLINRFLEHLKSIVNNLNDRIIELTSSAITDNKFRHNEDDLVIELVKFYKIEKEVFFKIVENQDVNSHQIYYLGLFAKENFFTEIIKSFVQGLVDEDFLITLRYNIYNSNSSDLSISFEKFVEQNSKYKFEERIDNLKNKEKKQFYQIDKQREFDILFDIEGLNQQLLEIFNYLEKNELLYEDSERFTQTFYKNNLIRKDITKTALQLLQKIMRSNYFENGLKFIKSDISRETSKYSAWLMRGVLNYLLVNNSDIILSKKQEKQIERWCGEKSETANIIYNKHFMFFKDSLWDDKEYHLINLLYKFQKHFKFSLDENTLLNMIFLDVDSKLELDFFPHNFKSEKITSRIIENINNTKKGKSIYLYMKYLLTKNVNSGCVEFDLKDKIATLITEDNYVYSEKLIELLYANDTDFLKELLSIDKLKTKEKYFIDFVLKLLIKNGQSEYVENYLITNYEFLIRSEILKETIIIKTLININSEHGFDRLLKIIEKKPNIYAEIEDGFSYSSWQNYSNEKSINDLIRIFEISITNKEIIALTESQFAPIRIAFESILSICQRQDSNFCHETLVKLNELEDDKIKELNGDLFYLNKLKNDLNDIIYNHKSKAYSFKDTLKLIKEYDYIFY